MIIKFLTAAHILCMIGAFGALLGCQAGLPAELRRGEALGRGISRIVNVLVGLGLLAGLALFGIKKGHLLGAHYSLVVGVKFGLLLAVGALVAMSKRPDRGDTLRNIACTLLAVAALLGSVALP